MTRGGVLVSWTLGAGFIALACRFPLLLAPIGAVTLTTITLNVGQRRYLARLAEDRQGESICSFARSFDGRAVDTWVIRAVFEELRLYCRFGRQELPLRPSDELNHDLGIDPEDLEDLVVEIAFRAGRSLDDSVNNADDGNVVTVSDLVRFLVNQPASRPR